ncbi:Retrovirus-related Pol polyprotein from transposon TNT 1-94 [Apostasia shenzhenica]|uniref:Retrovirus-related Pol polyprotein from transposon TNT 1-94 n=1 Tax=Apostasia shenzhenica TaxID=1088818 RepID=A0A2I0A1K2_9ASPA|nr:Retrovirus-related Pol polyprotein from transposon TNT 1-94 [Apostasia shenzhenica]
MWAPIQFKLVMVQDRATGKILLRGGTKNGLYHIPVPSPTALVGERTTKLSWHARLGHPSLRTVHQIIQKYGLPTSPPTTSRICSACMKAKSHKLSFSSSTCTSSSPLELIYSDIWGPAPIISNEGFSYYVIFVDNFSKFTWLFPMKRKSDLIDIFLNFQNHVERFFNCKIRSFHSDWGGEYQALHRHLYSSGIIHQVSCPHTPEQNDSAERKHRHIIETTLALLQHASAPQKFWDAAAQTAVYLINRLPTPILHHITPLQKLYGRIPDYNFLRIFGCACYPWLRPYTRNKLQPRSQLCAFLGYSTMHHGYRCLHISTGRVYISRHVVFHEAHFPFTDTSSKATQMSGALMSSDSILGPYPGLLSNTISRDTPPLVSSSPPPHRDLPASPESTSGPPCIEENTQAIPSETNTLRPMDSPTISASPPPKTRLLTDIYQQTEPVTLSLITNSKHLLPTALVASIHMPEPTCFTQASKDLTWRAAMATEFDALLRNGT